MTRHPEEGTLQAHLDLALPSELRRELEGHLEDCAACRLRLEELAGLAGTVTDALQRLDLAAPDTDTARWRVRRVRAARRMAAHRRRLAAAASMVLLLGAGLAAAVPGSPIRTWWDARGAADPSVAGGTAATEMDDIEQTATVAGPAAVSVPLVEGSVTVVIEGAPAGAWLQIELVEGERTWVTAPPGARFESGSSRIQVDMDGLLGEIRVEMPAGAPGSTVLVNGGSVLPDSFLSQPAGSTLRLELPEGTSPDRDG